ncbi:MAG TPA: hypothetical protein VN822_04880 [Candidatus Acidoferrales bacterium]|nr:hypothetical protein [Candidatus Acidoferrales bacterium]
MNTNLETVFSCDSLFAATIPKLPPSEQERARKLPEWVLDVNIAMAFAAGSSSVTNLSWAAFETDKNVASPLDSRANVRGNENKFVVGTLRILQECRISARRDDHPPTCTPEKTWQIRHFLKNSTSGLPLALRYVDVCIVIHAITSGVSMTETSASYEQEVKKTHTRLKTDPLNFWEVLAQAVALISPSMTAALIVPLPEDLHDG